MEQKPRVTRSRDGVSKDKYQRNGLPKTIAPTDKKGLTVNQTGPQPNPNSVLVDNQKNGLPPVPVASNVPKQTSPPPPPPPHSQGTK